MILYTHTAVVAALTFSPYVAVMHDRIGMCTRESTVIYKKSFYCTKFNVLLSLYTFAEIHDLISPATLLSLNTLIASILHRCDKSFFQTNNNKIGIIVIISFQMLLWLSGIFFPFMDSFLHLWLVSSNVDPAHVSL